MRPGDSQAHFLEETSDFLCKWGPPGSFTSRNHWFPLDVLCKWAPGFSGPIYFTKSWISYANTLLGIPWLTYLKRMLSVCGRREAHLLKEICDCLCKWAPGSPGGHLHHEILDFLCKRAPGDPQANLFKEYCVFLCKWAPEGPQAEITVGHSWRTVSIANLFFMLKDATRRI